MKRLLYALQVWAFFAVLGVLFSLCWKPANAQISDKPDTWLGNDTSLIVIPTPLCGGPIRVPMRKVLILPPVCPHVYYPPKLLPRHTI